MGWRRIGRYALVTRWTLRVVTAATGDESRCLRHEPRQSRWAVPTILASTSTAPRLANFRLRSAVALHTKTRPVWNLGWSLATPSIACCRVGRHEWRGLKLWNVNMARKGRLLRTLSLRMDRMILPWSPTHWEEGRDIQSSCSNGSRYLRLPSRLPRAWNEGFLPRIISPGLPDMRHSLASHPSGPLSIIIIPYSSCR